MMLKGKWLSEFGFDIGTHIKVECEDGRLIMKYGPGLLEKMNQEKLKSLISSEIESGTDKARFSARMLGYCKLMTDGK